MSDSVQANVTVDEQDAKWVMALIESGQDKTGLLARLMQNVHIQVQIAAAVSQGQMVKLQAIYPDQANA